MVFAQILEINQRFSSGESAVFHSDPLTNRMLTVENPCNDHRYLELQNKAADKMSDGEHTVFTEKDEKCGEYYRTITTSSTDSVKVDVKSGSSRMQPYILAGGGIIAVSVVLLIVL